ncbi:MAG: DUF4111 domain-containing protein [Nocardiopsaceae bacterium]|nr:DUF4111 domain-containing protein [Nocardiopsaceae bacterium]
MTAHKNRKRLVRERASRTGESYTAALRHLLPPAAARDRDGADGNRLPAECRPVLALYQRALDELLPGRVEGLYLTGPAAFGEFDVRDDRLNIVAVAATSLSDAELAACDAAHQRVREERATPPLAGLYLTREQLQGPPRAAGPVMAWQDGRLAAAEIAGFPVSRVNPVEWAILASRGITVRGPAPSALGVYQDRDELAAWTLANLDTFWRRIARQVRAMPPRAAAAYEARHAAWMVLRPSRLHYTIATGRLTSRPGGGAYAIASLPARWHPLVGDALAIHHQRAARFSDPSTSAVQAAIADFIDFVIADARETAEDISTHGL